MVLGMMLGSLVLGGCGEGKPMPAGKGGAAAREAIEYPLGRPPAPKHKSKKLGSAKPPVELPPDK
jgi:hypothetical protein